jgi:hypothetical protein
VNTPEHMGRHIADRVKGSRLKVYSEDTHLTITETRERVEQILVEVMGRSRGEDYWARRQAPRTAGLSR